MQKKYSSKLDFNRFMAEIIKEYQCYAPFKYEERNLLQEVTGENIAEINVCGYRTPETLKAIIYKITETVSQYFTASEGLKKDQKKIALLGVRACDLEGILVQDKVFGEGEIKDPFYSQQRERVLIISADCTDCGKTCFCNLVGGKPYAKAGFDINVSATKDGYIFETGSAIGEAFVSKYCSLFSEVGDEAIREVAENRTKVENKLAESNKEYKNRMDLSQIHKKNLENQAWKELTKDCVECSACNFICPTCSCFTLFDQKTPEGSKRDKVWDACLKNGYAKVAGGGNSRYKLSGRLQNRYNCKFDYSFDRLGRYTCVGCGRCIDGCAANIDMRKIFSELERQVPLTIKLE